MKKISLILNGLDDFDLGEGLQLEKNKPEETDGVKLDDKKVTVQTTTEADNLELTSETPDKKKTTVEIPVELLSGLMELAKAGKNTSGESKFAKEDFSAAIRELSKSLNSKVNPDDRFIGVKPLSSEDIDPEDFLEVPEMFFAHSVSYTLWDDKKFGQTIKTPYERPIKFKILYRTVDKSIPRQPKYYNVCVAMIQSKKVRDFLLKHSLFNVKFFRTQKDGADVSATLAEKLSMHFNVVNQMTEQEVVGACMRENISVNTTDASELRRRLAMQRAKRSLTSEEQQKQKKAKNMAELYGGVKDMTVINPELEFVTDGMSSQQSSEAAKGPLEKPY